MHSAQNRAVGQAPRSQQPGGEARHEAFEAGLQDGVSDLPSSRTVRAATPRHGHNRMAACWGADASSSGGPAVRVLGTHEEDGLARTAAGKRPREGDDGSGEGGQDANGGGGSSAQDGWQSDQQATTGADGAAEGFESMQHDGGGTAGGAAPAQLPLIPLVLPDTGAAVQQPQQGQGQILTPSAAAQAAAAEASQAAAAASQEAMTLSMQWLAAQQQAAAAAAAAADAGAGSGAEAGAGAADGTGGASTKAEQDRVLQEGISAAVDAATAAALAGGADPDTAAAMSASIAALMADPAAAAAAAAAMSDPNNPASMQALAQLAQLQSLGQLPAGASAEALNSSFSALVAAAVGMAALEGNAGNMAQNLMNLPAGFMDLSDPSALLNMTEAQAQAAGLALGAMTGMPGMDMQMMQQAPQPPKRGRPKKVVTDDGGGPQPTGNWMRRFHELAYLADKASLDAAKAANAIMTVHVQWGNMPEEMQSRLSTSTAPVEVPTSATVSFLKRAIGRALGGQMGASVLRHMSTRELITDILEDATLTSLGIEHNSYILLESETCHPIPNFGVVTASTSQRNNQLALSPTYGSSGQQSRVGTKERFTLTEMYSLVEGMEQHGLKWAKIHKDYKDLENKTQGDLKDKWRNWQRNVANSWTTARVYMPDELKQRIEKLVAEYGSETGGGGGGHGAAGGRLLQAPPEHDPHGHAAAAAAMAAHGLSIHGLDAAAMQLAASALDPHALAAQAHALHERMMMQGQAGGFDAAALAAALAAGLDPATAQQVLEASMVHQQQLAAEAEAAVAAAAGGEGGGATAAGGGEGGDGGQQSGQQEFQ